VEGLTKSTALEAAPSGVRVNMVAPGPIETGMLSRFAGTAERKASLAATVPLNRVGRPEEIAQTIMFLASDKPSSSRVRRTSSMAASRPGDVYPGGTAVLRALLNALHNSQLLKLHSKGDQNMNEKLVKLPGPDHPVSIERNPSRVIVSVAGRVIADTRNALTLREAAYPPVQYIPGPAGGKKSVNAVWPYQDPFPAVAQIKGHVAFYPERVDEIAEQLPT
jgi:uncharacterized protein (DUF427 family)